VDDRAGALCRPCVALDITSPPEQWRALGDGFRVSVRIVTLALDLRDAVERTLPRVAELPFGVAQSRLLSPIPPLDSVQRMPRASSSCRP